MFNFINSKNSVYFLLLAVILAVLMLSLALNLIFPGWQPPLKGGNGHEFTLLADSFLNGRLDLNKNDELDCSFFKEKCYWSLGPFPALLMMPGVLLFKQIGLVFTQNYLQWLVIIAVFMACYFLAKKFGYDRRDSGWLALAFVAGSVFVGVALDARSWYFSQAISVLLALLALWEYFSKKRYWLIGCLMAALVATRLDMALAGCFFALDILLDKKISLKEKFARFVRLGLPVVAALSLLGWYNFARFGNIFETGYGFAAVGLPIQEFLRRQWGLFDPRFIPTNFFYYFMKMPEPVLLGGYLLKAPYLKVSPLGLSFFLISPIFCRIFYLPDIRKVTVYAWVTSLLILFSLLCYYNVGYFQFGPRYLLDLLPFWFIILLYSFKDFKLRPAHRCLIGLSIFFDLYLFLNLILVTPKL